MTKVLSQEEKESKRKSDKGSGVARMKLREIVNSKKTTPPRVGFDEKHKIVNYSLGRQSKLKLCALLRWEEQLWNKDQTAQ